MTYSNHIQLAGHEVTDAGQVTEKSRPLVVGTCDRCGQLVAGWDVHDAWHNLVDPRVAPSPGQVAEGRAAKVAAKVAGRRRA